MKTNMIYRLLYTLGAVSLLAGILLSITHLPTRAASPGMEGDFLSLSFQGDACGPPADWGDTVRLHHTGQKSREWTFQVDQPVMDVTLEFFYYQDHYPAGCPYDCSVDNCQLDETGVGESPFGTVVLDDGKQGAASGVLRQSGRLEQGEYQAAFRVTARGSVNIGLRIIKVPVVTETPEPEMTETPTQTEAAPSPTDTEVPPTATGTSDVPALTPTDTATLGPPATETSPPPTATPTRTGKRPKPTGTSAPLATLPPPTPQPGVTQTPALIPVTGADLAAGSAEAGPEAHLLLNLGIGFLGAGFILFGLHRMKPSKKKQDVS